jgi:hypothetical protein
MYSDESGSAVPAKSSASDLRIECFNAWVRGHFTDRSFLGFFSDKFLEFPYAAQIILTAY